jgi:DNA-binding NtrC family response regulator
MIKGKILIIDDEENLRQLLSRIIELEGFLVLQAATVRKGYQVMEQNKDIMLVITDVKLPDGNGLEVLDRIKLQYPLCEVIVITAYGTIHDGVRAMKAGAFDYITKGDGDDQMMVTITRAFEKAQMQKRINDLETKLECRYNFDIIISNSKEMEDTISLARRVAPTDATVLLEGETGTGKELFAQSIHNASARKNKPFVAINCSAIPKELLESEIFGHKKGAFTGADSDKKGLFEEAHEGTLFLDEISEMNLDLQAKLLRIIESQQFIKLGDTKPIKVNVRIIAATNSDLKQNSEKELFRKDLYYRLSAFKINIPPLRERKEDIIPLAEYFLQFFAAKTKKRVHILTDEFKDKLKDYEWKGNVRELKNIIERAVILTDSDTLSIDLLPFEILGSTINSTSSNLTASLENIERAHIQKILIYSKGNKTKAANILNIGLTTLYRKIEQYNIEG